jgi:membrane-associated protease RseP (regulator of RpoE activity)
VNVALFLATLVTTFLGGYILSEGLVREGRLQSTVGGALAFSIPVMLILVTHEAGHKILSITRGVDSSWPYFIPFLPFVPPWGTLGAVIVTRTPSPNRDALMDMAAAGPLAGFLVALPVLIVGVSRSFVISPVGFDGISFPDPLLLRWLIDIILHPAEGMVVLGHPLLFAGWIGLLVTGLNLLPAGMLDGGHVSRALMGPQLHRVLSVAAIVGAVLLGYVLMALIILMLMRRGHPGPLDDVSPASPGRMVLGVILLGVFILSVVPLGLPF